MRIIDNVSDLLGDDLRKGIAPGSKVRIAGSTFSIFAFEALRDALSAVFCCDAFESDAARINTEQIFREVSPATEVRTI